MGSYKKKLFIVLLLILLLNFFVCSSVNAVTYYQENTTYDVDIYNMINSYQKTLATIFFNKVEELGTLTQKNTLDSYLNEDNFVIFSYSGNRTNVVIRAYFISNNIIFNNLSNTTNNINTNDDLYFDSYISYPITGYNISNAEFPSGQYFRSVVVSLTNNVVVTYGNYTDTVFVPTFLIYNNNSVVTDYKNGFKPTDSGLNLILNAITENTEQQEETTNEMKKLNDFMSSEDVDQDAYDMPTNNPTQDPTTDGINNIFNKFYSRITNWDSSNISVFIPFANKSFTIPANASEQLLAKFSNVGLGSTLKSLINAVWFYVLARYIIKDVQKYADGLKTGEILTKSDCNIKTEML